MSGLILGIVASGGAAAAAPYYLAASTNSGNSFAFDSTTDSSGNVYISGTTTDGGVEYTFVSKYDSSFTNTWKRKLNTVTNATGTTLDVDSSGNVYIAFSWRSGGLDRGGVAKYNSSGTLQWQRTLTPATQQIRLYGIAVDSSGNVHVSGEHYDNGGDSATYLVKYNTSGTLQWQRDWYPTYNSGNYGGIAVDSSSNVYIGGYQTNASIMSGYVMQFNSSGTKQWHRNLAGSATTRVWNVACNSTDVYFAGVTYSGTIPGVIGKYNSSGTLQWQRTLDLGSSTDRIYDIKLDSSANVYVVGNYPAASGGLSQGMIAKYNSSGTIQWQRIFSITSKNLEILGCGIQGNTLVFGGDKQKTNYDVFFGAVPTDGSKTGTYTLDTQSISYAAGTATDAAGSLTDSAGTSTIGTPTKTDAAGTFTDSALTSTDTKVQL